ncbi:hypothetical protein FB645_004599 [Coemansia sp. IMI 203386]|nr:hypothetical protein FB645_004599 [Coemansia sp. IMI 203386]
MSADTLEQADNENSKQSPEHKKRELANALVEALARGPAAHTDKPEQSAQQPSSTAGSSEGARLMRVLALGFVLRLFILTFSSDFVSKHLSTRVELGTPVASYNRLVEGLHLAAQGISPFDGGLFHQSPLLLILFRVPFGWLPQLFSDVLFIAADVSVALMLAKIAAKKITLPSFAARPLVPGETAFYCLPSAVAMLYLFNPLTLATCLARSTIVFSHLATVCALYFGIGGQINTAVALVAVATHLSLYPAVLIAPLSLMASGLPGRFKAGPQSSSLATGAVLPLLKFVVFFVAIHALFVLLYGFKYFSATVEFTLQVADLQPNVGLFWYFFIEIFDEFRQFFIAVFQLTALAFTVPISWRFRKDPLFGSVLLVGIVSALKSYPSWGDLSLFLGLIPIYEELVKYMQYTFLSANLLLYGVGLAPVFWHLWIEQGSGNANFFYAATLVYVFGQITLLFDLGSAQLRRQLDIEHPETRERTVVQE